MASIRTNPYHLYRVFLKLPGRKPARGSWTSGWPANVAGSLVTVGAAGSLAGGAAGSFAAGAASLAGGAAAVGGSVNAPGLDDMLGSGWVAFQASSPFVEPFSSPGGGGCCPNAGRPRAATS